MKIIFLGTPAFAVPTLERLNQSSHEIALVITQPDRPRSRGMQLLAPPVKETAIRLGIPVLQPEKASSPSVVDEVRRLQVDAAVVVAYGQLLKKNFLTAPRIGCVNLHASLLPKYRGPSPIQAAIRAGDRQTGATTMLLNEGMDTGDILLQQAVPINDEDTAGTLHDRLAQIGAPLIAETLDGLEQGRITPKPQDEQQASKTHKITNDDVKINWNSRPAALFNQVRAFDPYPGCETTLFGHPLKIWKVSLVQGPEPPGEPGQVVLARNDNLIAKAQTGAVRILELQSPGGRRMPAADFLRGHPIKPGTILGS